MDSHDRNRVKEMLRPGQIIVFVVGVAVACFWAMWQNHAIRSVDDLERAALGMKIATTVFAVIVVATVLLLPRVGVSLRSGWLMLNDTFALEVWDRAGYAVHSVGGKAYFEVSPVPLEMLVIMNTVMAALYIAFIARPGRGLGFRRRA